MALGSGHVRLKNSALRNSLRSNSPRDNPEFFKRTKHGLYDPKAIPPPPTSDSAGFRFSSKPRASFSLGGGMGVANLQDAFKLLSFPGLSEDCLSAASSAAPGKFKGLRPFATPIPPPRRVQRS